jgi:hypothetical protein
MLATGQNVIHGEIEKTAPQSMVSRFPVKAIPKLYSHQPCLETCGIGGRSYQPPLAS